MKSMKRTILILLVVFCSINIWASTSGTVYVKPGATGGGTSWSDAMGNIPDAVTLAKTGVKDVWIAAGTYEITTVITMSTNNLNIYGGFAGTETAISQRAKVVGGKPWEFVNPTILDGGGTSQIVSFGGTHTITVVDGFTMINGYSTGGGGAVWLRARTTIQNCIIMNSRSVTDGGGAIGTYGGANIIGCLIKNNRCGDNVSGGGGIYLNISTFGVPGRIENCEITGNSSLRQAGGIKAQGTPVDIRNCLIYNNTAKNASGALQQGGGIYSVGTGETVNCLVYNNTGSTTMHSGAGLFSNNTIVNNVGGVYIAAGTDTGQITNNIIWGCYTNEQFSDPVSLTGASVVGLPVTNNATYSTIPSGTSTNWAVSDNILFSSNDESGVFVGPTSFAGAITDSPGVGYDTKLEELQNADWALTAVSPCLDAGIAVSSISSDIAGNSRPQGFPASEAKFDIGAYELPYYAVAFTAYDEEAGRIFNEAGVAIAANSQLAFAKGTNVVLNFASTSGDAPAKVSITRSTDGGLTFTGEETNITDQLDPDGMWTTQVNYPFQVSVKWIATGLNTPAAGQILYKGLHNGIQVEGAANGENISIYHVDGVRVHSSKVTGNAFVVPVQTGAYIVRVGNTVGKVLVK
jgi:hypothetical protein